MADKSAVSKAAQNGKGTSEEIVLKDKEPETYRIVKQRKTITGKTKPVIEPGPDAVICPFCGKPSTSMTNCSNCHVIFNKEVLSVAHTLKEEEGEPMFGPITLRTAKILLVILLIVLVVLFVVFTEMNGSGFMGLSSQPHE